MKVYLVPGLGYDCRIFANLDFGEATIECLSWIEPQTQETISAYAKRLFADVLRQNEPLVLIGHSLGGIMAQELAAIKEVEKIILISSIKSRAELSRQFKLIAPLGIHRLFTKELSIKTVKYWGKSHDLVSQEEQDLFRSMVGQYSNHYLQWALRTLSKWSPPKLLPNTAIFHLHGTNDKTLPFSLINKPDATIIDGSHIMVLKRHAEISKIIQRELGKWYSKG